METIEINKPSDLKNLDIRIHLPQETTIKEEIEADDDHHNDQEHLNQEISETLYTGQTQQGKRHGIGKYCYQDGSSYEGDWVQDLPHGKGKITLSSGEIYEGEWVNGQPEGIGVYNSGNGIWFKGQFLACYADGIGVIAFGDVFEEEKYDEEEEGDGTSIEAKSVMTSQTNEDLKVQDANQDDFSLKHYENLFRESSESFVWYVGKFDKGLVHGRGKLSTADGVFEGEFVKNLLEGRGTCKFYNENRYDGEFRKGKIEGQGVMKYPDNTIYDGEWLDFAKNGFGITKNALDPKLPFTKSFWKGGKLHGKTEKVSLEGNTIDTIWYFEDEICQQKSLSLPEGSYEGFCSDDQPFGYGILKHKENQYVYKGEFLLGEKHGQGTLQHFLDNFLYEGRFANDQMEGKGTLLVESDGRYTGKFLNGKLHCKMGSFVSINGLVRYEGGWKEGMYDGKGKLTNTDRNVYQGQFKEGHFSGQGLMTYTNGDVYQGAWDMGKRSGVGEVTFSDGSKYKGNWKNDKMNGLGELVKPNLDKYECKFVDDEMKGEGKILYVNGNVYTGDIQKGLKEGEGTMLYKDGSQYSGEWLEDKYHGKGIFTDKDGKDSPILSWYKGGKAKDGKCSTKFGEWTGGLEGDFPYGNGVMVFNEKSPYARFEGFWEKTGPSKEGKMEYKDGRIYEGFFKDGKKNGEGVLKMGDQYVIYKGAWENNKKVGFGVYKYYSDDDASLDVRFPKQQLAMKRKRASKLLGAGNLCFGANIANGTAQKIDLNVFGKIEYTKTKKPQLGGGFAFKSKKSSAAMINSEFQVMFTYEGNFKDDRMDGEGKLKVMNYVFAGKWISGRKHGRFKVSLDGKQHRVSYYYHDKKCLTKKFDITEDCHYEGEVFFDKKRIGAPPILHGVGKIVYRTSTGGVGREYEGEFLDNKMDGKGKMRIYYRRKLIKTHKALGIRGGSRNLGSRIHNGGSSSRLMNKTLKLKSTTKMAPVMRNTHISKTLQIFEVDLVKGHNMSSKSHQSTSSSGMMQEMEQDAKKKEDEETGSIQRMSLKMRNFNPDIACFVTENMIKKGFDDYMYENTTQPQLIISGSWAKGMLEGKGKIERAIKFNRTGEVTHTELIYDGDFSDDQKQGNGKFIFSNGNIYIGEFKSNTITGFGTMKYYQTGDIYEGEWKTGKRGGQGKMRSKSGKSKNFNLTYDGKWDSDYFIQGIVNNEELREYYKGSYLNWKRSGKGTLIKTLDEKADLEEKYVGEFLQGKFNNHGELRYSNGDVYNGKWLNGKKNNLGTMTYENGGSYKGNWIEDKRSGFGKMTYPDQSTYEGYWLEDKKHYQGKFVISNLFTYKGQFYSNTMRGKGEALFPGGNSFKGKWFNGLPIDFASVNLRRGNKIKSGYFKDKYKMGQLIFDKTWNILYGCLRFDNGDTYKGSMKNKYFEGQGVYTWRNGSKYTGMFKGGKAHGKGKYEKSHKYKIFQKKAFEGEFSENSLKIKAPQTDKLTVFNANATNRSVTLGGGAPVEEDSVTDYELVTLPEMQSDNYQLVYKDDKTTIDDIRSVVSIESAYKTKYIERIDDYLAYKHFCDALEIENVINSDIKLVLSALEGYSLKELMVDILKTGSVSQRYIIIEVLMRFNFEFYIIFDPVRCVLINPFDRIRYIAANMATYRATYSSLVDEIQELIIVLNQDFVINDTGPLIFDEMLLTIIQTGLLNLKQMNQIFKALSDIYEDLLTAEAKIFNNERNLFKKRYQIYSRRRIILSKILLHSIIQLHDAKLLARHPEVFKAFYPTNFDIYKQEVASSFEDIISISIYLFQEYVTLECFGQDFIDYMDKNTNMSEICLNISYLLLVLTKVISSPYDLTPPEGLDYIHKKHVLLGEFFDAKRNCKNSSFTFGFYLKERLDNYDFKNIFQYVRDDLANLQGREHGLTFEDLSEMLIPSIIVGFSTTKKIDKDYHSSLIQTFNNEFSIFQLNSDQTMTKFTKWIRENDLEEKLHFSDWMNERGLIYIDFASFIKISRKDSMNKNNIKLMSALIETLDNMNNFKKGLKLSRSELGVSKIEHVLKSILYKFGEKTGEKDDSESEDGMIFRGQASRQEVSLNQELGGEHSEAFREARFDEDFDPFFEEDEELVARNMEMLKKLDHTASIQTYIKLITRMDMKQYNFFITLLELKFEYIVYPKFLLRNSSLSNFNLEKYKTLEIYTKESLKSPDCNSLYKKEIYHALIIGHTIDFRSFEASRIEDIAEFVKFIKPENKNDAYTRDLVYLIGLVAAKIWFKEEDALGLSREEEELKDKDVYSFSLVNRFLEESALVFKKEDDGYLDYMKLVNMFKTEMGYDEEDIENSIMSERSMMEAYSAGIDHLENKVSLMPEAEEESSLDALKAREEERERDKYRKVLTKQMTVFRKKRLEEGNNSGRENTSGRTTTAGGGKSSKKIHIQWEKLIALFDQFSDVLSDAKAMIQFDVEDVLCKIAKGKPLYDIYKAPNKDGGGSGMTSSRFFGSNQGGGPDSLREGSIYSPRKHRLNMRSDLNNNSVLKLKSSSRFLNAGTASNVFAGRGSTRRASQMMQMMKKKHLEANELSIFKQPKVNYRMLDEGKSVSSLVQKVTSEAMIVILTRHLTKTTSSFSNKDQENVNKLLDGDSTSLNMISILKDIMERKERLQQVIINELKNVSNDKKGITGTVQSSLLMFLSNSNTGGVRSECLIESSYIDSYSYYWIIRRNFNYFLKNISENNNLSGKLLFHKLESTTSLMDSYLMDLQTRLEQKKQLNKIDLALQRWKLEQLQELCVGPCVKNQRFMTQREYLGIFNFKYLNRVIPLDADHPKFKRDLSLINFYLSVIEGSSRTTKSKVRLYIKADEILNYLKKLLVILHVNFCKINIKKLRKAILEKIHQQSQISRKQILEQRKGNVGDAKARRKDSEEDEDEGSPQVGSKSPKKVSFLSKIVENAGAEKEVGNKKIELVEDDNTKKDKLSPKEDDKKPDPSKSGTTNATSLQSQFRLAFSKIVPKLAIPKPNEAAVKRLKAIQAAEQENQLEMESEKDDIEELEKMKYKLDPSLIVSLIPSISYEKFKDRCIETRIGENVVFDLVISSYLLLNRLNEEDPFKKKEIPGNDPVTKLYKSFVSIMKVVELSNMSSASEVVIFPMVKECKEISKDIRDEVMQNFDPHNPTGMFYSIILDIKNTFRMLDRKVLFKSKYGYFYRLVKYQSIYRAKILLLMLSLVMNVVSLVFSGEYADKEELDPTAKEGMIGLNVVIFLISFVYIVLLSIFRMPLIYIKALDNQGILNKTELMTEYMSYSFSFWGHLIFAVLSLLLGPIYYTLHMLVSVSVFESTQFITKALMKNFRMLIGTLLFMVLVILTFSYVISINFPSEFDQELVGAVRPCDSFFRCFIYTLDLGLIFGGGIAEALKLSDWNSQNFSLRTIIDIFFFLIVNVILLNIIFGLIIDSFAELRDESNDKINFLKSRCPVCLNGRRELENANNNFIEHTTEHHDFMRYIEYFLFLRSKDASGYNGIEYYVAKCLDDKNINFLPGENTRFLLTANGTQGAANKRKDEMAKFVDALDELKSQRKGFDKRLKIMETRMEHLVQGVDTIIKQMSRFQKKGGAK